jgi:outer membrane receptor for ferrienterochelin and colicins
MMVRTRAASALVSALAALAPCAAAAQADRQDNPPAEPGKDAGDAQVQQVEVKGKATDYDPRRDDTASKTVMTADEIRKYGDDNIYDVLKRAPGVTISGKSIRMRGLGNGYTQILVNGDRPPPGFSFDALTPDQIERIEIMAAGTAEFSMQSIAGTINIVLRKVVTRRQRDLRANASYSGDGRSVGAGGTWGHKAGNVSYFLNASVFGGVNDTYSSSADRFTLPDGELTQSRAIRSTSRGVQRGVFLLPHLAWKRDDDNELGLSGMLQASRGSSRGSSHTDNLMGTFPNPDYVDTSQRSPRMQDMAKVDANWIAKLGGGKLDMTVSAERGHYSSDSLNDYFTAGQGSRLVRDWRSNSHDRRYALRAKFTRSLFDGHSFAAGVDVSTANNAQRSDRDDRLDLAPPVITREVFESRVTRLAGWAQDEWSIGKHLSLYLGLRWEGVRTDSEGSNLPETRSSNHVPSPVTQMLYKFPDASGRQLRLAYTRTYRAPDVSQLTARRIESPLNTRFAPDSSGNPDLRPELATGIDVTYERYYPDGTMYSASVSRRAITDTIRTLLDLDDTGRWIYRPVNDGTALVRSLQLEFKLPGNRLGKTMRGLQLRGSYSRNWSRVGSLPGPGIRVDGQTPASATLGTDYAKGAATFGASLTWFQGGWIRVSETEYNNLPTRSNLDAYLLWKLNPRYQVRFSASNLLGTGYASGRYYRDASGTSYSQSMQDGSRRLGVKLEVKL